MSEIFTYFSENLPEIIYYIKYFAFENNMETSEGAKCNFKPHEEMQNVFVVAVRLVNIQRSQKQESHPTFFFPQAHLLF